MTWEAELALMLSIRFIDEIFKMDGSLMWITASITVMIPRYMRRRIFIESVTYNLKSGVMYIFL